MKSWLTRAGTVILKISGGRSNVFLICRNKENILVDTGRSISGKRLIKKLYNTIEGKLDYLIITHTHFDHAGNLSTVKTKFNPQIIVHESEAAFLLTGDSPLPAGTNFFTKFLVSKFGNFVSERVHYQPASADIIIKNKFDLRLSDSEISIIHTPGHSQGSVSIIVDNEIALVGDTLFGVLTESCYPPFADDTNKLIESWGELLKTGCRLFLPSHGGSITRSRLEKRFFSKRAKS